MPPAVVIAVFAASLAGSAAGASASPELQDVRFASLRAEAADLPAPEGKALPDDCQFLRDQLADPSLREVVVPAGTYVCAKPVVLSRSGVTLRGQGRPTLRLADHAESPLLVLGGLDDDAQGVPTPVTGLRVEGLVLEGNRAKQSGECWGGPCDTGGTTGVRNNGLTLRGVKDSSVRDVEIRGARSGGLVTERDCAGIHVQGLKAADNFFDGLSVNWTRDSVFEGLELSGNDYAGLTMDVLVKNNVFRDGSVSGNRDVGVYLRRAEGNRFERLKVSGNRSHGVYLSDADAQPGTCAVDNVFFRVEALGNGRDGFHMAGACAGNRLEGSVSAGNQGQPFHGAWMRPAASKP